jgi:hypothetical protein
LYVQALRTYEEIHRTHPENVECLEYLIRIYKDQKDLDRVAEFQARLRACRGGGDTEAEAETETESSSSSNSAAQHTERRARGQTRGDARGFCVEMEGRRVWEKSEGRGFS